MIPNTRTQEIVDLAKVIFNSDLHVEGLAEELPTGQLAEASIWAAHSFFNAVDRYVRGDLGPEFARMDAAEAADMGMSECDGCTGCDDKPQKPATDFDPVEHFLKSVLAGVAKAKSQGQ